MRIELVGEGWGGLQLVKFGSWEPKHQFFVSCIVQTYDDLGCFIFHSRKLIHILLSGIIEVKLAL